MQVIHGTPPNLSNDVVATIGTFDGLHLGHQQIISQVVSQAKKINCQSLLITFDCHPLKIINPSKAPPALLTAGVKLSLLGATNLDTAVILNFNSILANLPALDFCQHILVDRLNLRHLFVGENFRFGAKALGDTKLLSDFGKKAHFDVTVVPLVKIEKMAISSTKVRELFSRGKVEEVKKFLGRYHFLTGKVVTGDGRGQELGYPTANIEVDKGLCLPAFGVYAGFLKSEDNPPRPAVFSVGSKPTFNKKNVVYYEAHILNYSGNLYGRRVVFEFQFRLRRQKRFNSVKELVRQIKLDVSRADKILKKTTIPSAVPL